MNTLLASSFLIGAFAATAQDTSDLFYQAIRHNNLAAVRELIRKGAVNTKDSRGDTPLMYAAFAGSVEGMKLLLDAGADPNAKNEFDATALLWASGNIDKVRLLLARGAEVNARSKLGRTPLLVAAAQNGSSPIARLLIDKGADVSAFDNAHFTVLEAAALANDTATVRLLLAKGADAKARDDLGLNALFGAAINGNAETIALLMAAGTGLDLPSVDSFDTVKHGPIALGRITPLLAATPYGGFDSVRLLVEGGANVNAKDTRGMTPLSIALASDRPDPRVIRLLLDKGAAPGIKSAEGESALDWAGKFRNPEVVQALGMVPGISPGKASTPGDSSGKSVKAAVENSIALLQRSSSNFLTEGGCVACHAQNLTGMAVGIARANGAKVDDALDREATKNTLLLRQSFDQSLMQLIEPQSTLDGIEYTLLQLSASHVPASRVTDAMVHYIAAGQRKEGNWSYLEGPPRAPLEDGNLFITTLGLRCLQLYEIPARRTEFEDRIKRAADWLQKAKPRSTSDRVMQLLGLKWADRNVQPGLKELLAMQQPDGGWPQTPYLGSDAYGTGQVLYTLHELGVSARATPYRQAVQYLLRTQHDDGSWHVKSRSPKFQPYFESGFPHGHDQWISSAATAWATMGLAYAIGYTESAGR